MQSKKHWEDTLYPTGIYWVYDEGLDLTHYLYRSDIDPSKHTKSGPVWGIHCATVYGGCGVELSGNSKKEVIKKWNTRANAT